jgi:hypothetical protein
VDGALDQLDGLVRRPPVAPPHARGVPPPGAPALGLEDDGLAVPDGRQVARLGVAQLAQRQVEGEGRVVQDVVDVDEDGRAQLNGLLGGAVDVDRQRAPANVPRLLKQGDVDVEVLLRPELLKVVRR